MLSGCVVASGSEPRSSLVYRHRRQMGLRICRTSAQRTGFRRTTGAREWRVCNDTL